MQRIRGYRDWKQKLEEKEGGLETFATGYNQFGFHRDDEAHKWTYTEWLPEASQAYLIGEFNGWSCDHPMKQQGFGRWSIDLPDGPNGTWMVPHRSQVRVRVVGEGGQFDRVPAWAKLAWQDHTTLLFNGVFWEPPKAERYVMRNPRPPRPESLKVYEAHVGMSSIEPKVATYLEFKDNVLPRIKKLGYNAVQFMAIAEHAHYGSFGYNVTSFFAPASRSGTPEELKEMIDAAHGMGLIVLMDLVHAHCSPNQTDGIAAMDGTDHCYTHGGGKGLFHYTKWEVLRFLLSNCRWWLEEYGFDGFRFDGVTSMLYHSHGIGKGYSGGYDEYFGLDADMESHVYMMLANDLIHRLLPNTAVTVAEDVSGMPTLCRPCAEGGLGFDYGLSMAIPDMWIKILKEAGRDENWKMGHICSHDQATVGDKTTAFCLMDAAMYTHMSTLSEPSMVVDRGLALHKMIRLITSGLGGEGYLNFIGNEFGHPKLVDFPTEFNGWSYRRLDFPDSDDLKYSEPCDETGSPPSSTGEETPTPTRPATQNVPDYLSECGSDMADMGKFTRVASLSALDTLIVDTEEKLELRRGLGDEKVETYEYEARHLQTPVVVVSSEVNPWSKTGGLASVAGSYGYEFAMRGHRTMVVSPRYGEYEDCIYIGYAKIWLDGKEHEVGYFHQRQEYDDGCGADYIFVEHCCYHRPAGLYWDPAVGKEYSDNLFRFALLSVAALEAPLVLNLNGSTYGQDVCFIANDWQAGLVPSYLVYKYRRNNTYRNARCIFVIHNIGYQGKYPYSQFPVDTHLGLPMEALDDLQGEDLNLGTDCLNLVSNGIKLSDRTLTVSPNYASEIQSPEGGQGLHDILRGKGGQLRLGGILNGISDEWNPRTDPHIPVNYGLADFMEGKAHCKAELQRSLGLNVQPDVALVGFCGRLCYQKGIQLITAIVPWLLQDEGNGVTGRVQLLLMGKGEEKYGADLRHLEHCHRGRVCGYVGFDPRVEHKMMAGCDFLLMPSQYEPCGLPQMYAQAYGTLPIVHETGGLKDSVRGLWDDVRDRQTATGFLFCGFDENKLKERLYQALEVFHKRKDLLHQMQENAIMSDYYWPKVIDEYEKHIDWTMESHPVKC